MYTVYERVGLFQKGLQWRKLSQERGHLSPGSERTPSSCITTSLSRGEEDSAFPAVKKPLNGRTRDGICFLIILFPIPNPLSHSVKLSN